MSTQHILARSFSSLSLLVKHQKVVVIIVDWSSTPDHFSTKLCELERFRRGSDIHHGKEEMYAYINIYSYFEEMICTV